MPQGNELAQVNAGLLTYELTEEHINILSAASIIPADTPPAQVQVFARICAEKGLSPFSKEIHLVNYKGKFHAITGIDGFRSKAGESGMHAGTDDAKFDLQPDGSYSTAAQLKAQGKLPKSASVTVYKAIGGIRAPFTHTALFSEFSTGKMKWATMPFQMIAKVAEAFALRKGFPRQLSGLHVSEEIGALNHEEMADLGTTIQQEQIVPIVEEEVEAVELENWQMDIISQLDGYSSWIEVTAFWEANDQWHNKPDAEVVKLFIDKTESVAQLEKFWKANEATFKADQDIKNLFFARKKYFATPKS